MRHEIPINESPGCYDAVMSTRERQEQEGIAAEVEFAAGLTDADRIRIFRDLLRTADAICKSKSPEELRRDEEVRRSLRTRLPRRARRAARGKPVLSSCRPRRVRDQSAVESLGRLA